MRIAIIEDDEITRLELSKLLNTQGYETVLLTNFENLTKELKQYCVELVLLDINLPYENGYEVCRKIKQAISFSELPDVLVDKMAVWDDYETDYTIFSVCGIDIRVLDDELAEALKKLPERKRNTLLMYYFLEMTESEIANLQKITQSGVFRNRHHALETMKKILKEEH